MKRHLMTLVLSGVVGSLVLAGNAEACHKKKCTHARAPICMVVEPAPCPLPAPVCEPTCAPKKKCGLFAHNKGIHLGGHHKKVCAERVAPCETVAYSAPVSYYSAPAVYSSSQASYQH
jgi:hypothetical protein